MGSEIETRRGTCAEHGPVEATRNIPKIQFPYVLFAVLRAIAKRRPFLCPRCGKIVHVI